MPEVGQLLRWLGGKIDIRVQIAALLEGTESAIWDVSEWGESLWAVPDEDFQDVSQYVMAIKIGRGQDRWEDRFRAGTCTITLDNDTGLFSPDSGEAPWATPFEPGRLIRVMAVPDPGSPETLVPLFTGRIDTASDSVSHAGAVIVTTFLAMDALAELAQNNPPALEIETGVQDTDERVQSALDRLEWAEELRSIEEGSHTMPSSALAQSTLEECQRAAEAEGGVFYADTDNTLVFKARDWLTTSERSTTYQGYLGYETPPDEPSANIVGVNRSFELARVKNDIQFARDGGELQQATDEDSIALRGIRTFKRTDLNNNSDAEVLFLAERYLAAYKDPRPRIDSVTIVGNADPENDDLNRLFYALQFGDLLSVQVRTLHGWSITKDVHVIGIEDDITPDDWTRTLTLDDSIIEALEESSSSS